jgi:SAM-dependent methyltransferase
VYVDDLFGPVLPEHGWVPAPSYALRRARVLEHTRTWAPGALLEIGCGVGALLYELGQGGHDCTGLETSPAALKTAEALALDQRNVSVVGRASETWTARFDYVLAFEVLEHVERDEEALRQWASYLRPGGKLLLSVPAHRRRWSASDEWAGHVRRYERTQLSDLVRRVGLQVDDIECYGFPIANLVDPVRSWNHARLLRQAGPAAARRTRKDRTDQSGVSRSLESKLFPLQRSLPGRLVFRVGLAWQQGCLKTELGTGYLLLASKVSE